VKYLGIDPGIHGGLCVIEVMSEAAHVIDAIDVPVIGSAAKERIDILGVREWLLVHRPAFAFVERAQALPHQGASSGFKFGRATGALEATVALCGVPLEIVEPSMWKKFFRLPGKDKEAARQRALELFPAAYLLFARKRDHQRAEAALIALFGFKTGGNRASPGKVSVPETESAGGAA
jgi:crossover junction endodeoxyribonuclease RuvC